MGSFAFDKDFLPIVRYGDYIQFLNRAKSTLIPKNAVFQVTGVEPVQPFMIDVIQISGSGVTSLAANGTVGDRTGDIPASTIATLLEADSNVFIQYRIALLDDFLLKIASPGPAQPLYSTSVATTYLQKVLPTHDAQKYVTTAPATDFLLWQNSTNVSLAGELSGMTPIRRSRIIGIQIYTSGATIVSFGDAAAAGGTKAAITNPAKLVITFASADWTTIGRDQIPEGLEFVNGIVFQQSAAVNTLVCVTVEEDSVGMFGGHFAERQQIPIATQADEIFVYEDIVPSFKAINPLNVTQTTARIVIAGFQFSVAPYTDALPSNIKPTAIPVGSINHAGARNY